MGGVIEEADGGGEAGGILPGEHLRRVPLVDQFDESLQLGRDQHDVDRSCPEHAVGLRYRGEQPVPHLFLPLNRPDLLSCMHDGEGIIWKCLLEKLDVLEGDALLSLGTPGNDSDLHGFTCSCIIYGSEADGRIYLVGRGGYAATAVSCGPGDAGK